MKYILIAVFVMEQVTSISAPWATSFTAEFDDLEACEAAKAQVEAMKIRGPRKVWCAPKSSETGMRFKPGAAAGEAVAPK